MECSPFPKAAGDTTQTPKGAWCEMSKPQKEGACVVLNVKVLWRADRCYCCGTSRSSRRWSPRTSSSSSNSGMRDALAAPFAARDW